MKPCKQNEKPIAWLALQALGAEQSRELRAHLNVCPGCRQHWEEISSVCHAHAAAGQALQGAPTDERFHQRLVRRIERGPDQAARPSVGRVLQACFVGWRMAAASAALVLLGLALLSWPHWRPGGRVLPDGVKLADLPRPGMNDLDPTLAHYQAALDTSLEAFDQLLAWQAINAAAAPDAATSSTLSELELEN